MSFINGLLPMLLLLFAFDYEDKIDKNVLNKIKGMSRGNVSVVVFSKSGMDEEIEELIQKNYGKIKYKLPIISSYAVEVPCDCINQLAHCKKVKYIADDAKIFALLNVATEAVGSTVVNRTGYTGKGIGIAILDTGVYPHPDLIRPRNRITAFKDFINDISYPYDDNNHGTHIAGDAAGNGYASDGKYKGIAPEADIIGVKVMNASGTGNTSDIVAGMQWVVDNKDKYNIRIMSLSIGAPTRVASRHDALAEAAKQVWKSGIVVTAAAGNAGPGSRTITTPGISPPVITVGAVDDKRTPDISDDTVASFSSRGPTRSRVMKPDVVAPGVSIMSLNTDKSFKPSDTSKHPAKEIENLYRTASGTSMATPMVAGYCALLLQKNPHLTPDEIKIFVKKNAVSINERETAQGKGLINIQSMIK